MIFEEMYNNKSKNFKKAKRKFFRELVGTFSAYMFSSKDMEYSDHILNIFLKFKFNSQYVLDFELDFEDFRAFNFNFSKEEWMQIYRMFSRVFKYENELNPFIYLFFYDLIYVGPFSDDIEELDMSDELLSLMGDDMLRLYNLFDEYLESHDSDLIKGIIDTSRQTSIPAFVVSHLASWFEECVGNENDEIGDLIIDLYLIAVEKIYKKPEKPELYDHDFFEIESMRYQVDTSNFNPKQLAKFYEGLRKY